eukprot:4076470-Pyramimonas_sp.AAC.1
MDPHGCGPLPVDWLLFLHAEHNDKNLRRALIHDARMSGSTGHRDSSVQKPESEGFLHGEKAGGGGDGHGSARVQASAAVGTRLREAVCPDRSANGR